MKKYALEIYQTKTGKEPFKEWIEGLKDSRTQSKIAARLRRASFGNFGDFKSIKGSKGLYEMREHSGAGYRIFYSLVDNKIILLLAGSSKKDQKRTIAKARDYLIDYERSIQP